MYAPQNVRNELCVGYLFCIALGVELKGSTEREGAPLVGWRHRVFVALLLDDYYSGRL